MRGVEFRTVRAWASALGGTLAAVATLFLGLANGHVIMLTNTQKVVAVAVIAVVAIFSAFARPLRIVILGKQAKRRSQIGKALRGLPWAIHRIDPSVPVSVLGASAWIIKGWGRWQRLERIGRERVNDSPGPTNITWTKGKGVVGRCWQDEQPMIIDTGRIDERWGNCTAQQWAKVREDTRMGLSHEKFRKVTGKYGTVVAVPMYDAGSHDMIGCVTLDAPKGLHDKLQAVDAAGETAATAAVIANFIR